MVDRLVAITGSLTTEADTGHVMALVTRSCAQLLDGAAGVLLTLRDGSLRLASASDEEARIVEILQSQTGQGPCVQAITGDAAVVARNLGSEPDAGRWPLFTTAALAAGFAAVLALSTWTAARSAG
jgi:hypothetical protein